VGGIQISKLEKAPLYQVRKREALAQHEQIALQCSDTPLRSWEERAGNGAIVETPEGCQVPKPDSGDEF